MISDFSEIIFKCRNPGEFSEEIKKYVLEPVPLSGFRDRVRLLEKPIGGIVNGFCLEFYALNWNYPSPKDPPFSGPKNRYSNIVPHAHTRVKLSTPPPHPKPSSRGAGFNYQNLFPSSRLPHDYINASHVDPPWCKTKYILASAPLPNAMDDFFLMIWDQKVSLMVMLTKLRERDSRGRSCTKADAFWPESTDGKTFPKKKYGEIELQLEVLPVGENLVVRTFTLTKEVESKEGPSAVEEKKTETRKCIQLHYTGWPDHGIPEFKAYSEFYAEYRKHKAPSTGPILVLCSAGAGRTGVFVEIDSRVESIETTPDPKISFYHDGIVMREKRPGLVQTHEQYAFCYLFLEYLLMSGLVTPFVAKS